MAYLLYGISLEVKMLYDIHPSIFRIRVLEHFYHVWLLLSYYSALNNNIETFHILSVQFAIIAQDDSPDHGGGK